MSTDPAQPIESTDDDYPLERRWVRASEIATLVKHMGRVIPGSEWQAAISPETMPENAGDTHN